MASIPHSDLSIREAPSNERFGRIVRAALEVFCEFTYPEAKVEEVARRAHVSKRDIYASFPTKQDLLAAVVHSLLIQEDDRIELVLSLTRGTTSLRERLEIIGLALLNETVSLFSGSLLRIVPAESIHHPELGSHYFEHTHTRRVQMISAVLLDQSSVASIDTADAAEHYLALVLHLPYLSTLLGKRALWNHKTAQAHIESAVSCLLRAYPGLSA